MSFNPYLSEISTNRMESINKNIKKLDELSKIYPELNRVSEIIYFYIPFVFSKEDDSEYWFEKLVEKLKEK